MANRPMYIIGYSKELPVEQINIDFKWFAGMSISQKQKSICSLHDSFLKQYSIYKCLEISSKSMDKLGIALSAFNLSFELKNTRISVECAFQGSKVFTNGGPYIDLYSKSSREAKKDERIRNSGSLEKFISLSKEEWPLSPKTLFYDWIYLNALHSNQDLVQQLLLYNAFSDIEFNPKKSINSQAYSVALYLYLHKTNNLKILSSKNKYIEFMSNQTYRGSCKVQSSLF